MALFTRFCKAKPPYSETAEQVPKPPLTSSADCYALALVGNTMRRSKAQSGRVLHGEQGHERADETYLAAADVVWI